MTTEVREALSATTSLDRTINLPGLIFYGLGVTVGAGIFALLGEILGIAGDNAPLSFLIAGLLASLTGASYMLLVGAFPQAGAEAAYVNRGLGALAGRITGLAVVVTGIITGAVVALAFAGYLATLISIPESLSAIGVVLVLGLVAWWGVRESVILAAVVTLVEVGTLIVIILFGLDLLATPGLLGDAFTPSIDTAVLSPILAGSVLAFFAFVGFENIANMAEETIEPRRTGPIAIAIVLATSVTLYVLLALIAVAVPDRGAVTESTAPMAALFREVSGLGSEPVAMVASFAMINGILIQIVMAARVLYGMANQGLAPTVLGQVDEARQTPARATVLVVAAMIVLIVSLPLVELAELTSFVTLVVFTMVNAALFMIGRRQPGRVVGRFRWVGLLGAISSISLAAWQIVDAIA